jgi:hypothetical protein
MPSREHLIETELGDLADLHGVEVKRSDEPHPVLTGQRSFTALDLGEVTEAHTDDGGGLADGPASRFADLTDRSHAPMTRGVSRAG